VFGGQTLVALETADCVSRVALRAVVLLAGAFPEEQKTRIHALIDRHIEEAITKEWATFGGLDLESADSV
jgi:hypothetical protein